ncbi:putative T6SS immunity periplasmic lipoprotein [Pantoea sp. X85]|jgi:hypothetical protein|uniref:putative T6SS immunity periplasmic lipoprotein n=1 Tax=Pantoea sp. X85 TaxID=3037258 RepID=UPI0024134539|nr:putative T6SS immunity periplasmic lipoprotein [Pantoea sp. X85]WFL65998.1 hypothetical protein P6287_11475 [Pantoea sp. X85]
MVKNFNLKKIAAICTLLMSSVFLFGCPGVSDRGWHDETTEAVREGQEICFPIKQSQGYIPTYLAINQRDTPRTEQQNRIVGDVEISDGMLCLPPDEFTPAEGKEYVVKFILKNGGGIDSIRSFVVAVKVVNGKLGSYQLQDSEISRGYK